MKPRLTVVILTKNAGAVLDDCLTSARFADELLVFDSGSSDDTATIAARHGARLVTEPHWHGFGRQRQLAQQQVQSDWILWLDSDERITPQLRSSIETALTQADPEIAYRINRLSDFFGRYIRHSGWYPDRVVRLHHRDHYRYNDAPVHEAIEAPATKIRDLDGDLLHHTSEDLQAYFAKSVHYAVLWGRDRANRGKKVTVAGVVLRPFWTFFRKYFIQLGFLDGSHGLLLAIQSSHYTFNKYFALWVAARRQR